MYIKIVVFFGILSGGTFIAHADESVETKAAAYLSNVLYSVTHEVLDARLRQSGLPKEDIEEMTESAARFYAICVVDALVSDAIPGSKVLLKKLANGASSDEVQETFSEATLTEVEEMTVQLESVIVPCLYTVNQELGIVN